MLCPLTLSSLMVVSHSEVAMMVSSAGGRCPHSTPVVHCGFLHEYCESAVCPWLWLWHVWHV